MSPQELSDLLPAQEGAVLIGGTSTEEPGQMQTLDAGIGQLRCGESRALLHEHAPGIGSRREELTSSGQRQPPVLL